MSKKTAICLVAGSAFMFSLGAIGCRAEAHIGNTEAKAAVPTPPPAPPKDEPKPVEAPAPKVIRALGKAKIEGNDIKVPGKVHFETDKSTLKDDKETKEILQTIADVMKNNPQISKLRIEGHTDDSGASEHNHKLSQARAEAVIEWLSKNGVDKARLEAKGMGEDRPLAKNDTKENKEQNRRVEFKLWEVDGKATDAQKNDAPAAVTPTKK